MKEPDHNKQNDDYRKMTVANIREHAEADHVDIVFLESARFYKLYRSNPGFEHALGLLKKAVTNGNTIKVGLASPNGDVVNDVMPDDYQ